MVRRKPESQCGSLLHKCREGLLSYSLTGPHCVSPSNSAASHCRTVLMLFAGPVFVLCVPFQAVSLPVQLLFLRTFL